MFPSLAVAAKLLCGIVCDGKCPKEGLNLFEFTTGLVAEACPRPAKIVRREIGNVLLALQNQ